MNIASVQPSGDNCYHDLSNSQRANTRDVIASSDFTLVAAEAFLNERREAAQLWGGNYDDEVTDLASRSPHPDDRFRLRLCRVHQELVVFRSGLSITPLCCGEIADRGNYTSSSHLTWTGVFRIEQRMIIRDLGASAF